MKANKTQPTPAPVESYFAGIKSESRRADARDLSTLMEKVTKTRPVMWGSSIVGFGSYHYEYESGRQGDSPAVGFSSRAQALTIYGLFHARQTEESIYGIKRLGTYTTGKGCLYIKRLSDVNMNILEKMISASYDQRNNS